LITGTIPLLINTARVPANSETQRVEYMASATTDTSASISTRPDSNNFGSFSYNITHGFQLRPKSIKTFPFLSANIVCNYTLEASTYLSSGHSSGLFQRSFTIQTAQFLPAGIMTFYLAKTSLTLGQARLADMSANSEQKLGLGSDSDVKYNIISSITTTRQTPVYGQDMLMNVTVSNRKDKQLLHVTLKIHSGYRNTTLIVRARSSTNIIILQDPNDRSILLVRAFIKAKQDETCTCIVKQSN
jgi:hypothetical protein